jgi:hypothetical protein
LFKGLFSDQNTAFCFGCHDDPTSGTQYQISMPNQYNYSHIAGGYNGTTPNDVKEAFQQTSNHDLTTIRSFIKNQWNFPAGPDTDPCSGCHNPHRVEKDPHIAAGRIDGSGNLIVSSVSRPSRHSKDNNAWDLWGDENGERMRDYALTNGGTYQAPYRYLSTNTYEPDGSGTITNGSNLFDTVTFCLDCHHVGSGIGTSYEVNWGANGDVHGSASSPNCCNFGDKIAPYPNNPDPSPYPNYILSCLDCHEPHGSPNPNLLREEVNGTQVPAIAAGSTQYWYFCSACHQNINTTVTYHSGLTPTSYCSCHVHTRCWPSSNCNSFGLTGCASAICDGYTGQVPGL